MSPYRKAVAAVVGVTALLLAQVFGLTVDASAQGALVEAVLAVGTVVAVYRARNHTTRAEAVRRERVLRDPLL